MRLSSTLLMVLCAGAMSAACTQGPRQLHVITTNDVHGAWFDSTYVGGRQVPSLMAVNTYVDSIRNAVGKDNVLLLDAGDCLQGDNAAYYFNYVDTLSPHVYPRLVSYMGYDAVVVGNHDVETGHKVYDKVTRELKANGIPFLAGNALKPDGDPYWLEYQVFKRAGMKVLVLGYTNANMAAWLDESLWSGMKFVSLVPFVQQRVDALKAKVKPDVTIVAVHSGVGAGDGTMLENQGLDLFHSLRGVDLVVTSHDHRPRVESTDSIALVNTGSKALNYSHTVISMENGVKHIAPSVVAVDAAKADVAMHEAFADDYAKVKAFTLQKVGSISADMSSIEAFSGRCFYMDFIHYVQLHTTGADISFAAPLTFKGFIPKGELIFNDMFTVYPYENTLNVLKLKGSEIRNYLEYSYDLWITNPLKSGHIFNMSNHEDARYTQKRWSFNHPSFNFDSASGINYTVDVTKPYGKRIKIASLADGRAFDENAFYTVAMTSYRAAGGGDLLFKGAGLSRGELSEREVARYPEIRDIIYEYFKAEGVVGPESISGLGDWHFVPRNIASSFLKQDSALMFGE